MGWMTNAVDKVRSKKPESEPPAPFHVGITDEEYIALPWTVTCTVRVVEPTTFECPELGITAEDPETFDVLCRTECRQELSQALDGHTPKLPTGLVWKDGKPARDPGPHRILSTKRY